jgi:hypothetical protein
MSGSAVPPFAARLSVSDPPVAVSATEEATTQIGTGKVVDQLRAVDDVLAEYHLERRIAIELQERRSAETEEFGRAASHALRCVVKPALVAFADRLMADGVGGLVEEHPPKGRFGLRLVLWIALDGPIVTPPRQDHNPYLQLDLDVEHREVRVWEGDMWLGLGASRLAAPLALDELTASVVTGRAVAVLQRAADHAKRMLTDLLPERDLP